MASGCILMKYMIYCFLLFAVLKNRRANWLIGNVITDYKWVNMHLKKKKPKHTH